MRCHYLVGVDGDVVLESLCDGVNVVRCSGQGKVGVEGVGGIYAGGGFNLFGDLVVE